MSGPVQLDLFDESANTSRPDPGARPAALCGSCNAPIVWAKDPAGKSIPVNHGSDPGGNLAVQEARGGGLHVRYLRRDSVLTVHEWRATSHFASCPDAAKWRERGSGTTSGQGAP